MREGKLAGKLPTAAPPAEAKKLGQSPTLAWSLTGAAASAIHLERSNIMEPNLTSWEKQKRKEPLEKEITGQLQWNYSYPR